jgi:hypothetical protein
MNKGTEMVDTLQISAAIHTLVWFVPVAGALLTSLFMERRYMFIVVLTVGIILI